MSPARILVVDDDPDIRYLVSEVLRLQGHAVETAGGGLAGITHLAGGPAVDLVILDVQMPDVDGWDTLRAIREMPRGADVPVVLCTVKAQSEDLVLGWSLGCDGYLRKPFAIADLHACVDEALARTSEERRVHRASMVALARSGLPVGR